MKFLKDVWADFRVVFEMGFGWCAVAFICWLIGKAWKLIFPDKKPEPPDPNDIPDDGLFQSPNAK
jgi:hypothetical protein